MAINSTKLSGGGEVGESVKKVTRYSRIKDRFMRLSLTKRIILIVGVVLLVVGSIYSYGLFISIKSTPKVVNSRTDVCGSDQTLLNQIAQGRSNNDINALKTASDTIKSRPNYEDDQNCLYGVLMYSIFVADPSEARRALDRYHQVYHREDDKYLGLGLRPDINEKLDDRVATIEKQAEEAMTNVRIFSPSPSQ